MPESTGNDRSSLWLAFRAQVALNKVLLLRASVSLCVLCCSSLSPPHYPAPSSLQSSKVHGMCLAMAHPENSVSLPFLSYSLRLPAPLLSPTFLPTPLHCCVLLIFKNVLEPKASHIPLYP